MPLQKINPSTHFAMCCKSSTPTFQKVSSSSFQSLSVSQALVTPNQISIFSNIYRHKSPILTLYQLIESRTVYLVEFLGNFVKDTILKMFPLICKIMFHPQICWLVPLGGNKEEGSCAKFSGSAEYREGLGQQHYRLVIIIFVIIIIVIIISWTYSWQQKSK